MKEHYRAFPGFTIVERRRPDGYVTAAMM